MATRFLGQKESIFSEMNHLAKEFNAVNLGQGAPNFYGPQKVLDEISSAVFSCHNQYSPPGGEPLLKKSVANFHEKVTKIKYHFEKEILITNGASEALYCAMNAFLNPKDKVLIIEPAFDIYFQALKSCSAEVIPLSLHAPDTPVGLSNNSQWSFDWKELDALKYVDIKMVILNTPHNPTGKVFNEEECNRLVNFIYEKNCLVVCDEVYENLIYENHSLVSLCTYPKIQHLCIRISSAAKTLGFTGLKCGWAIGPEYLIQAMQIVHQSIVFCVSVFTQLGIAHFLNDEKEFDNYLENQRKEYDKKRKRLSQILTRANFILSPCQGSFFIAANYEHIELRQNSLDFSKSFTASKKIATIPMAAFYLKPPKLLPWVRFTFCKTDETFDEVENLLL